MDIPLTPFAEWLPDLPVYDNPGAIEARNCIAAPVGYEPFAGPSAYSAAVNADPDKPVLGAVGAISGSGAAFSFCGDADALYRMVDDTDWADASRTGGYNTAEGERWRFGQFGDLLLATNYSDEVQAFGLTTSTAWGDLGATVPRARYIATVRDFIVLGYTTDSADGEVIYRVWWSPIGNPGDDDWGNIDKQSDFQDLFDGIEITGITGGEIGIVFLRNAIYRMTYTGDAAIFQFDALTTDKGCVAPGSVAKVGNASFFLAEDGFYQTDGASITPIGLGKVDRWFQRNVNPDAYGAIHSVIDPQRRLYLLAFPMGGSERCNAILAYRYDIGRWTWLEVEADVMARLYSPGYTLEQLDAIAPLDDLPASLDSRVWAGGGVNFGIFGRDRRFGTFGGLPLTAVIDTAEIAPFSQRRGVLKMVRPIADGTIRTRIGRRDLPAASLAWTGWVAPNTLGATHFRANARYLRVRCEIGGEWSFAHGVEGEAVPAGRR